MDSQVGFGVPKQQRMSVAKILYEAFQTKLQRVFEETQYTSLPAKHLRDERTVIALREGLVVGVGGLTFDGTSFLDLGLWKLLRALHFNLFRFLFFVLMSIDRVEQRELLVDVLAVARGMPSTGIGTQILDYIIAFAESHNFRRVKLSVIDTNQPARRLYERMGFRAAKIQRIPFPINRILGFHSVIEMTYTLS